MELENIKDEIDHISLAGTYGKLRLVALISRTDFDDAIPGNLSMPQRRRWVDRRANTLAALMIEKFERGESFGADRYGSHIETVTISIADLQRL